MLQKLNTVFALGAVFLTLTAGLLGQNVELGLASTSLNLSGFTSEITDLSSNELFAYEAHTRKLEAVKLASAVEAIERRKVQKKDELEAEAGEQRVASTSNNKNEVNFVDTINQTLPPIVEKDEPHQAEILDMIRKYAAQYGANAELMIAIARCESGLRSDAVSPSGAYRGIYQFVASTWISNRKAMGEDPNTALMFDVEESIKTAAFKMGRDGYGAWPVCSKKAFKTIALN